jgi:RNA polymerase sigma factor (sigma-70 family)
MIAIPADKVVGCYKLHRRLGGGTFGEVWVGSHCHLGGYYAVKLVPANGLGAIEREGVRRYKTLANSHPGLVPINDFGEVENLCYYYAMPLADDVKGLAPLRDPDQYEPLTLDQYWKLHKPLPLDKVLTVARHLLRALQDLHEAGLVHRDVKPGNVVMMDGVWKLTDVSLLIRRDEIRGNSGTPWFVPPEGNKDRRADLYALGKILFLLATDLPRSDFQDFMQDRQTVPGTDERREALQRLIKCACQDDSRKRYQTAAEMRQALDTLIRPVSITVVLDEDFRSFTPQRRHEFLDRLRRQGYNVSGDPRFEEGSVRVTLQLMPDEAERLAAAVQAGDLANFHAVAVEVVDPAFPHLPTAAAGGRGKARRHSREVADPATEQIHARIEQPLPEVIEQALPEVKAGSRDAINRLFEEIYPYLKRVARRFLIHAYPRSDRMMDEEDLALDCLFRAWRNIDKFRGATASEFLAWLTALVRIEVVSAMRMRTASERASVTGSDPDPTAAEVNILQSAEERVELVASLESAIAKLSEPERIIIQLYYFDNLTTHQIALQLAMTENSVRARLSRARAKLRNQLADD